MRKKSKALVVAMCALVLALGVNATYAYLTDSASATNTFTVGNVDISLTETDSDQDGSDKINAYKMVPGQEIAKDPKVSVTAQSEDCWLFVEVEALYGAQSYLEYPVAAGWTALVDANQDGVSDNGVYWRAVLNADSTREFSVLDGDKVTVIDTVDKAMMDALIQKNADGSLKVDATGKYVLVENLPKLTFTAYAIQKAGFDSSSKSDAENAAAAWAELSSQQGQ